MRVRLSSPEVASAGALPEVVALLDRVVPIGEALAFDVVWDGFHLIDDVLRRVRVRGA